MPGIGALLRWECYSASCCEHRKHYKLYSTPAAGMNCWVKTLSWVTLERHGAERKPTGSQHEKESPYFLL